MLSRSNFHGYQDAMLDRILNPIATDTDKGCSWAGMGLGKTAVGLTAAETLMRGKEIRRTLVVSTKKAAEHTWLNEHGNWEHLAQQSSYTHSLMGAESVRKRALGKPGIHVINQELLPWLVKGYGVANWPYDYVIVDDCKGFKTPSSVTFRALRHVSSKIRRLTFLNGTPMPRGYLQLWPQIFTVDNGARLERTFTMYRNKYFEQDFSGFQWHLKDTAAREEIMRRLEDIAFAVNVDDYLDVPVATRRVVKIPLPRELRAQYNELEATLALALDDTHVDAPTLGVLQNKLMQFCNGSIYTDPSAPGKAYRVVHDLKLDALEEVIDQANGENLIVAYSYKPEWERIKARFPQAVHLNSHPDVVKRWNAGDIPLLCCHPGSGGHGLNLQYGGRTIVWFGAQWSLELNQQMDERIGSVRQVQSGLNKTPVYIHLAIEGSVEEYVAEGVEAKASLQEVLKRRLKLKFSN